MTVDAYPAGAPGPAGVSVAYQEFTAPVTINTGTEAASVTVVTAQAFAADGVTPYTVEFFAPAVLPANANGAYVMVLLYDGATIIGQWGVYESGSSTSFVPSPMLLRRRLVPSAGSHTYTVRAYAINGNGQVTGGASGTGAYVAGYIKVVPGEGGGPAGPTGPAAALAGWTALPYAGSWANLQNGAYTKDSAGIVRLRGLVQHSSAWTAGSVICNLPAGYRSTVDEYLLALCYNGSSQGIAMILVQAAGNVQLQLAPSIPWGASGWISFTGLTFANT